MFPDSNPFPGLWGPVDFRPIPKSLPVPSQSSGAGTERGARPQACDASGPRARGLVGWVQTGGRGDESDR